MSIDSDFVRAGRMWVFCCKLLSFIACGSLHTKHPPLRTNDFFLASKSSRRAPLSKLLELDGRALLASLTVSLQFVLVPVYSFGSFQLVRDQFQAFLNFGFKTYFKGDNSVRRYESEFTRLKRYVHYGQKDEPMIIRKFLRGLSPYIRSRLEAVEFGRLSDLVERAVNVEEAIIAERASSSHSAEIRRQATQNAPRAPQAGSSRSPLPFPIPPAKRQAISGRAYALE
ncbi:hypothetical protein DY000_02048802 [Brassica cretica]|uniref:Retrotransposon gag domain-containing protein n=1 Tax=Brassica cretica TaxID=69181 RepID=A0ABQ7F034_BRACR|nr:hypothetical protein DY000_02048802 [Brassica cretica]